LACDHGKAGIDVPLGGSDHQATIATSADYIVVEMAKALLGPDWMKNFVQSANAGEIERVLM